MYISYLLSSNNQPKRRSLLYNSHPLESSKERAFRLFVGFVKPTTDKVQVIIYRILVKNTDGLVRKPAGDVAANRRYKSFPTIDTF